jgi:hypothetical protein
MKRVFTFLIICINLITISKARQYQLDSINKSSGSNVLFGKGTTTVPANENVSDIPEKANDHDVANTNKPFSTNHIRQQDQKR